MLTLTQLEEDLQNPQKEAGLLITQFAVARDRLQKTRLQPQNPAEYQQLTLLLHAIDQAETIINVIYFRCHSRWLKAPE